MLAFESCKVLGLGCELWEGQYLDGESIYMPTAETIRRADEMGRFYWSYPEMVSSLICSGYYPQLASTMAAPPAHISEANMMRKHLLQAWSVPPEKIAREEHSVHTFDNLAWCIRRGYIQPGEFDAKHPLVLSVSRAHSWRVGLLATRALVLPENSLFCLDPGQLEENELTITKERELAKLTKLAIDMVPFVPDGGAKYVDDLFAAFSGIWENRTALLNTFKDKHGIFWLPDEIPVLEYH